MPADSGGGSHQYIDNPVPRAVRPNQTYRGTKNMAIFIPAFITCFALLIGYVILGRVAGLLKRGQRVSARIENVYQGMSKTPSTSLQLSYKFAGRSYMTSASISPPIDLHMGDQDTVVINPESPDDAWYGSLDQRDYDSRYNVIVGVIIGGFVFGLIIFIGNESELRQDLRRMRTWPATLATLQSVETGGRVGTTFKVTYDLDGKVHSSDVRIVGPLKLNEPIEILVDPGNPQKVILPAEIRLAELGGSIHK